MHTTPRPGPEGLAARQFRAIPLGIIVRIFNLLLWCENLPKHLAISRTIFIPKKSQSSDDDTWASAQEKMNKLLDKIASWLALNKPPLNANETVYMTVGNYCGSVPKKIEIEIHKQEIKRVTDYK